MIFNLIKNAQGVPFPEWYKKYWKAGKIMNNISNKSKTIALLLCIFAGYVGLHRFYVGKNKSAILYLFTFGLFGIGWIADFVNIANNLFTDSAGCVIGTESNTIFSAFNPKKPAQKSWLFWVVIVFVYAIIGALQPEPTSQPTSTDTITTDSEIQSITDTDTGIVSEVETDTLEEYISSDEIETIDEPQIVDLCDTDTDYKEYSLIVARNFRYHCNNECSKLEYIDATEKEYYTIKTPNILAMEEYLESCNLYKCNSCANWDEEKEAESAKAREEKTENIDLCSDTDGEMFAVVYDKDKKVYHLNEKCQKVRNRSDEFICYYNITASDINDVDDYFKSKDSTHCAKCVEIEIETESDVSSKTEETVSSKSPVSSVKPATTDYLFIVNTNSNLFHHSYCHHTETMSDENRMEYTVTAVNLFDAEQYLESKGFIPCKNCIH